MLTNGHETSSSPCCILCLSMAKRNQMYPPGCRNLTAAKAPGGEGFTSHEQNVFGFKHVRIEKKKLKALFVFLFCFCFSFNYFLSFQADYFNVTLSHSNVNSSTAQCPDGWRRGLTHTSSSQWVHGNTTGSV
ncbi:hypothetical protein ILYODFUR_028575 [Ilyodon furcidens]|uniref:Uncharacterized protein n=1 Tax=Ilyodon furcidens TaxID=33524 RepID=A0ABV0UW20_9TELE